MRISVVSFVVLLSLAARALAEDVAADPKIDALLEPIRAAHKLPALAGAIVTSNGLVTAGAVGVRKAGVETPVTVNDLWHLGSNTKAMTATLIGVLVEEGKLRWDSTPAEVFPELAGQFTPEFRDTTLTQLLNVPLFLATWGPERYGVWLMLNTVPVYLGLSDLGFTGVAANRINMMIAAGNQKRAVACFQSALALLLTLGVIVTAIAVGLGAAMGGSIEGWTGMSRGESVLAMLMIAIQVFGYTLALLSHGVFCSSGRYAEGTLWFNLSRLLEFCLLAMGVYGAGSITKGTTGKYTNHAVVHSHVPADSRAPEKVDGDGCGTKEKAADNGGNSVARR